ncbi:hypothetical protein NFX39_01850 [Fructobacillus sp. W13]|uniref:DUF3137 domain-containing protein n=1 Tax=Fructobacillus apis TaxID=2935017 RepID=A0ABT0ZPD9_9LACO|nr:hypothetical protein [Fructobacillus apis]
MERIIDITQGLLAKQARNQRNLIYFQIAFGLFDVVFVLLLSSLAVQNQVDAVFVFGTLLVLMANYLFLVNIKRVNAFNASVQYQVVPKIITVNDFASTSQWLKQHQIALPKQNIIQGLFSNKPQYWVWGCIETDDGYQIIIVDLSQKNTLIALNTDKNELNSNGESAYLMNLIQGIHKKIRFNQSSFKQYMFSHVNFYVHE